jgi:PST family polysaccharide transporter
LAERGRPVTVLGRSVKGVTYSVAVSVVTMVLGFARSVLLMRLLGPEEFGHVSLALFFMVYVTHVTTMGLDSALIQRPSLGDRALSTHLTLRTLMALGALVLGLGISPGLRLIYTEQPRVVDVLLALLLANVLSASFSTPNAVLRRELRFGALAVMNLVSSLVMTVGAPLMALLGAGVWSLVFEQVAGYVVRWVGLWVVVRPCKPALGLDREEARSMLGFGRRVLLSQFLGITLDRFDDFWAGTALGATPLGYYSRAYEMAGYPARVLATPVTYVFFSTFSALQRDRPGLSRAVSLSSSFLVRVGFLIAAVLLTTIPEVTLILLGEVWLPIVPVLRMMAIYVVLDPLYENLSYLAIGMGRPETLVRVRVAQVLLFVLAVVSLARWWGIAGIAMAANLTVLAGVLALGVISARFVDVQTVRVLGWPIVALLAAFAAGVALDRGVQWPSLWTGVAAKALGPSLTYAGVLWAAERRSLISQGKSLLEMVRASPTREGPGCEPEARRPEGMWQC